MAVGESGVVCTSCECLLVCIVWGLGSPKLGIVKRTQDSEQIQQGPVKFVDGLSKVYIDIGFQNKGDSLDS